MLSRILYINTMLQKLYYLVELTRLRKPTGYLLLFFPCVFGSLIALKDYQDLVYIIVYFVGSIIMRSAGCIINDLTDIEIDKKVDRTKARPLAAGHISKVEALFFLLMLLLLAFPILSFLSTKSVQIALFSLPLIILYPWMKRITFWPQLFLGITFNLGILIAYTNITNDLTGEILLAYIGCIFWTLAYDSIYAFMDIKDDKLTGVKSSAIVIEKYNYRIFLFGFYAIFFVLIGISAYLVYYPLWIIIIAIISSLMISLWLISSLDIKNRENCMHRFNANNYLGLFWSMILLSKLLF